MFPISIPELFARFDIACSSDANFSDFKDAKRWWRMKLSPFLFNVCATSRRISTAYTCLRHPSSKRTKRDTENLVSLIQAFHKRKEKKEVPCVTTRRRVGTECACWIRHPRWAEDFYSVSFSSVSSSSSSSKKFNARVFCIAFFVSFVVSIFYWKKQTRDFS